MLALHLDDVAVLGGGGGVEVEFGAAGGATAALVGAVGLAVEVNAGAGARRQLPLLPVGLQEDHQVCEDHDCARNEERDGRRDDRVHLVHAELAHLRVLVPELLVLLRRVP